MGVPIASGVPNYDFDGTIRFNPELYSGLLLEKFYKATVFGDIASTAYEGEVAGFGAQVVIRTVPNITISNYVIGAGLTPQYPTSTAVTLSIDQAKSFNVALNLVTQRQSDLDLSSIFSDAGVIQLQIEADADMLETIPSQVAAENQGSTAGADSGSVDLGTVTTPVTIGPDNATGGVVGVVDFISNCGQVLDEQSVSPEGRWIVIPPWMKNAVMKSPLRIASLAGDGQSIARNGRIGEIAGFMVYESRSLLKTISPTTSYAVMFGHSAGLAFAAQIVQAEMINNPNDFGYLIRGLMVFGFKVIGPQYVGTAYVVPA